MYDQLTDQLTNGQLGSSLGSRSTRPLDSGAASSAACRQGKKDIGRSRKKKKKKKGQKEEEEDKDIDIDRLNKGRNDKD